ncbi:hypothetical protein VitviT2T_009259 [Vitis vinifera]|uniref:PGG domain-containing protein n=1 Tax=Vitis vinifera TaxID=29760 RepID=A0ABY9C5X2_VITVI|nr:uncharacterized protein LOC100254555 isoform X2 [Vitis vinifera]WJZ90086.1 hypothetical protein VitviT2T_009259 [Vitis vinifera]|eukprot:XP_019073566.1 PREDICTED: uncharacterized protein LOC100254555 isoform X2 [Vitis vinifera]
MALRMEDPELEGIKTKLFERAMEGRWKEVIEIYKNNTMAHRAKITVLEDTALHIAVLEGKEAEVEKMVYQIGEDARMIKNKMGNTPLHLAASIGNVSMCKCIANRNARLVGARNKKNETPLFLAALQGKKDAFLCLLEICRDQALEFCRRDDGETILHCAITGEYFDLAFTIILEFPKLANYVNEQGLSPLHLLANKPTAFRSGTHLSWIDKIIYYCVFIPELKHHKEMHGEKKDSYCLGNTQTCVDFFLNMRNTTEGPENAPKSGEHTDAENPKEGQAGPQHQGHQSNIGADGKQRYPPNYGICFEFIKLVCKGMLAILLSILGFGFISFFKYGSNKIKRIIHKKQKHTWSIQIMKELLQHTEEYKYYDTGSSPHQSPFLDEVETFLYAPNGVRMPSPHQSTLEEDKTTPYTAPTGSSSPKDGRMDEIKTALKNTPSKSPMEANQGLENKKENGKKTKKTEKVDKKETPILLAAKNGIAEMVREILDRFPVAIQDMNSEHKNMVLLAVENRQPHVYELLLNRKIQKDTVFRIVDKDGNSALHLAAMLRDNLPWHIPGAALQMQWEIKWFDYVKNSMPIHFFPHYNANNQTPKEVFNESHKELVEKGGKWLKATSDSCSVVSALIATVAFATSATVPGGIKEDSGKPILERQPAFRIFAISSLVALCFSVTSVVMFLAILTSRYQVKDFRRDLPRKLLLGLSSLFVSIAAILVSFCAGHFFVLKDELKYAAFPVYAVTCLPVTFFAIAQFPLYLDLVWATFKKVPKRGSRDDT